MEKLGLIATSNDILVVFLHMVKICDRKCCVVRVIRFTANANGRKYQLGRNLTERKYKILTLLVDFNICFLHNRDFWLEIVRYHLLLDI